ncbi:MAG: GSCFA domain-containing protein [Bacteroidales bacterium]|nr:GSCFA domain-containing protein [Bacteroidales bacterium]
MLKLQTPVSEGKSRIGISYKDRIMMLGSCFSDSIGRQLADFGFNVCVNPFGTLYNPISILKSVERLASGKEFTDDDCIAIGAGDERICSFSHHTSFARGTREEFLDNANRALKEAREFFLDADKLIITLGTSWCFRHKDKDMTVSNCLKRPSEEFIRERLSVEETAAALSRIRELTGARIILTVSPIRHFKDGAHGNQLSKATLLLGIEEFLAGCPVDLSMNPRYPAEYFPSYEIVMDELRDYRFYAEDMCHPSQQTVSHIRERFLDWALPDEEQDILKENIRTFRHGCHISKA